MPKAVTRSPEKETRTSVILELLSFATVYFPSRRKHHPHCRCGVIKFFDDNHHEPLARNCANGFDVVWKQFKLNAICIIRATDGGPSKHILSYGRPH
jgi:hypothetical protein